MLRLALLFLVIALIAAVLGFGGIAGESVDLARICALVFIVLAVISFAANALRGKPVV